MLQHSNVTILETYIDIPKLQQIQDSISKASRIYVFFYDKAGVLRTHFSGTDVEEAFVLRLLSEDMREALLYSFSDVCGDQVIDLPTEVPYLMAKGIAVRARDESLLGAWLILGFDPEKLPDDTFTPSVIRRVSPEEFEAATELFAILNDSHFSAKAEVARLSEQVQSLQSSEYKHRHLEQKTDVLVTILRMMESEEIFEAIAKNLLEEAASYLDLGNVHLLKQEADGESISVVCEWARDRSYALKERLEELKRFELPFFNGQPYTVSYDVSLPKDFADYFARVGINGGVFLPIMVNHEAGMYLCFTLVGEERRFSTEDIQFMNEMKRVLQDILVKRVTKNSLASSYHVVENIIEHAGCGVCVVDCSNSTMLYSNHTYQHLLSQDPSNYALQQEVLNDIDHDETPLEFASPSGGRWYEVTRTHMDWVDGREVHLITIYDITKVKLYQAQIERAANEDYLTGIYNRMRFDRDLDAEMHSVTGDAPHGAVILIDLDDFSNINEALGHQVGDSLLRQIAKFLQRIPGIRDNCYRFGADEFVILINQEKIDELQQILDYITTRFAAPWELEGVAYHCTCSVGVARIPRDGVNRITILERVDIALHDAKRTGKNHVAFYNEETMINAFERLDVERHMRDAVDNDCKEFEVYYQPLVHHVDGENKCCGAEALVRWLSPELGLVKPDQFISLAEYLGLINPIGRHVLMEACKRCKHWNDFGHPDFKINVNLSVVQLLQDDIVGNVRDALSVSGLNPDNLTLEVTESLAINDMRYMNRILSEIKALGVHIALDDFGTGYSALSYLRTMPVDIIKIDRCFLEDAGEDEFSDVFIKTVTQLAESLDMEVCIEGVEKQKQFEAIEELHVDWIQGFLFDQPLPAEDFEEKYV